MNTEKIYDAHFHLLFKHFITDDNAQTGNIEGSVDLGGLSGLLDEVFGGLFNSQSAPEQINDSPVCLGVVSLLSVEHAFANKLLHKLGVDIGSKIFPIDRALFEETKNGKRTYYDEFNRQLAYYLNSKNELANKFNIHLLNRADFVGMDSEAIETKLNSDGKRYFALAMEGGHNLSNVPIRTGVPSNNPELQLKALQDGSGADLMSMNLCHLSYIPEQPLGGFAQGLNNLAQFLFTSNDFKPTAKTPGLTERGKKVIRQALTHTDKPVLIDVKHMSVYSRFHYYRYREQLIAENNSVARLPIISSHTGFTFTRLDTYIREKQYLTVTDEQGNFILRHKNRQIGKTDDNHNDKLYANPWTIGLYDEEITEIMASGGQIGISMDQRVLGAAKMAFDGARPEFYEDEYVGVGEGNKLFVEGSFPQAEGLLQQILGTPTREERHFMLFCMHIIHAVRIGYQTLVWADGTSPWQHIAIGSDYDGLINPINGYNNVTDLKKMRADLTKYLPLADKYLSVANSINDNTSGTLKALKYTENGTVDAAYLKERINDFLFGNGVRFIARYLTNWGSNLPAMPALAVESMAAPVVDMQVNETRTLKIKANERFSSAFIDVKAGQEYKVTANENQTWVDLAIRTSPTGYHNPLAEMKGQRVPNALCFCLCGVFGKERGGFPIGNEADVPCPDDAQLYFFANDVWGFEWNNWGSITIDVLRTK